MKIKGSDKISLKQSLDNYFEKNNEVSLDYLIEIINKFAKPEEKIFKRNKVSKKVVLYTTGAGNVIQGGADIWVNNFLNYVWPSLPNNSNYKLLIDSKKPYEFKENSLPKGLEYHFHNDDPEKTKEWLGWCDDIVVLHSHYHKRPHIWHWEDKFKFIFIHAYPRDMKETIDKIPELKRLQFSTDVDVEFYDAYLQTFRKRCWIGLNDSEMLYKNFPNYTYKLPNYYEFKQNKPLSNSIKNGRIGFAARAESRKCLHWMNPYTGYALTNSRDVINLRETTSYSLKKIRIYEWKPEDFNFFMNLDFGIFHGAYFLEPFGYSIFQAVDYGKLPIIHKDWAKEVDYKYRASTQNEFDKVYKMIMNDSQEIRQINFDNLKSYMKKFEYKTNWVSEVKKLIN